MLSLRLEQLEMFCATQTHSQEGSVWLLLGRSGMQERGGGVLL